MLAKRQPLLWAFVGGGLLGAALIGFLGKETASMPSPRTPTAVDRIADALATIATTRAAREQSTPGDDDRTATKVEPASRKGTDDVDAGSAAEAGSSVADVLTQMEAAYRERLAGRCARREAVASGDRRDRSPRGERGAASPCARACAPCSFSDDDGVRCAGCGCARGSSGRRRRGRRPGEERGPRTISSRCTQSGTTGIRRPPVEGAPVLASRDAPPAGDVYLGNVTQNNYTGGFTQNTYTGNPHQSDAVLTQQLAMLQYMQYMQLPSRYRRRTWESASLRVGLAASWSRTRVRSPRPHRSRAR